MTRSIAVTATPNAEGWTCQVRIEEDGRSVSEHTVQATRSDVKRLAPHSSVEDLVRQSFESDQRPHPATLSGP